MLCLHNVPDHTQISIITQKNEGCVSFTQLDILPSPWTRETLSPFSKRMFPMLMREVYDKDKPAIEELLFMLLQCYFTFK
jgi:hypothetical protein